MATKDEQYDPGINLCNQNDKDLNNAKLSPGSSPSAKSVEDVFVYNDTRKGGPLSDKDKTQAPVKAKVHCTACGNEIKGGEWIWDNNKHTCSRSMTDQVKTEHRLCENCARSKKCRKCRAPPKEPPDEPNKIEQV